MDILERIGDTIVNVGKDVTKKAKDVSGIAKLKLDIRSKEDFIKEQYIALGKSYYEKNKGTDVEETAQFERIEEALEEIKQMKLQILDLKNARKCPDCGAEASDKAEYCSVCGAKLTVVVEDAAEKVVDEAPFEEAEEVKKDDILDEELQNQEDTTA